MSAAAPFDEICPPLDVSPPLVGGDPAGWEPVPIHERTYVVQAYRRGEHEVLLRGAVRDTKPPGLYVRDDPDPLPIHHMVVDLVVAFPSLTITDAAVVMETHPNDVCPSITEHYGKLVGLSIARGFTASVRELFGGPRGCTHVTALLQAMAPIAVQSIWSMGIAKAREAGRDGRPPMTEAEREQIVARNVNSCHVWAEGGDHAVRVRTGTAHKVPIPIRTRLIDLGRDPDGWTMDGET